MDEKKILKAFIRGFRKIVILQLLCIKPRYGYNLIVEFKRITGRKLKPSVIYPFLYTLEKKGYVVGTWMVKGKRSVKSYEVTQKGKALLSSVKMRLNSYIGKMLLDFLVID